jgi:hypothetical protein
MQLTTGFHERDPDGRRAFRLPDCVRFTNIKHAADANITAPLGSGTVNLMLSSRIPYGACTSNGETEANPPMLPVW